MTGVVCTECVRTILSATALTSAGKHSPPVVTNDFLNRPARCLPHTDCEASFTAIRDEYNACGGKLR